MASSARNTLHRAPKRANSMLVDFDPELYRQKIEHSCQALFTLTYKNPKGEDVRSMGFLCVIRLPNRGNVFGLMTNSHCINFPILESSRFFSFDLLFDESLVGIRQHRFTLSLHRDVESWFSTDGKHFDVTFLELRPELQLSLVANGNIFLAIFEHRIDLREREVLILDETKHFTKGTVVDSLKKDTVLQLSRFGLIGSPVLDDATFAVVAVAKTPGKICRDPANNIFAIIDEIIKENLRQMPYFEPPKRPILTKEITQSDMTKSRFSHIRDSVVIPFHLRMDICERLQKFLIMSQDDLLSCTAEQVEKVFPEESLRNAVLKWQKVVSLNAGDSLHYEQQVKNRHHVDIPSYAACRLASCLREAGNQPAKPTDIYLIRNYFANWDSKQPKQRIFEAPTYIRSILTIPEQKDKNGKLIATAKILTITSEGMVFSLPANDWSSGPKWQVQLKVPGADVAHVVHAVYDEVLNSIYVTVGDGNIFRARVGKLKEAGESEEGCFVLKTLLPSSQTEGRIFWGVAVDSAARLMVACDNGGACGDISFWRLPAVVQSPESGKESLSPIEQIASVKTHAMPAFVAFFTPVTETARLFLGDKENELPLLSASKQAHRPISFVMAVSDLQSSKIELFAAWLSDDDENLQPATLRHLGPVARRDVASPLRAGFVNKPCQLAFDPQGNLFVADQLNHRVEVFSLSNEEPGRPLKAAWASKPVDSMVECFALARHPKTGRTVLLTHVDYRTLASYEGKE